MIKATKLNFFVLPDVDCKYLSISDLSYYSSVQLTSNATIQIITPFDDEPVELDYYKNSVTVFNSNMLGITNVSDTDLLTELPDGLYTAKISVCPEDVYWFEKSWYRTCLLECRWDKTFLKLNIQSCEVCFSPEKLQKLERARMYIYGAKTNANNCNMKEADKLYKAADKLLTSLLDCDCN